MLRSYKKKVILNNNQISNLIKDKKNGKKVKDIIEKYNISRQTYYDILHRHMNKLGGEIEITNNNDKIVDLRGKISAIFNN